MDFAVFVTPTPSTSSRLLAQSSPLKQMTNRLLRPATLCKLPIPVLRLCACESPPVTKMSL